MVPEAFVCRPQRCPCMHQNYLPLCRAPFCRLRSWQLDVSLLACGSAGGPPRVVAAGTLPLQSDWLTNEVDILRNTAAAAVAAATAAGMAAPLLNEGGVINSAAATGGATGSVKPPQPSSVSETLDVPLYLVTVQSGSSRQPRTQQLQQRQALGKDRGPQESMALKLRLSLDVQQVDSSWAPFLSKSRRGRPGAGGSAASAALSGAGGASSAVAAAAAARGGRRAIRLAGSDVWVPFNQTGGIITAGPGGDTLQASSKFTLLGYAAVSCCEQASLTAYSAHGGLPEFERPTHLTYASRFPPLQTRCPSVLAPAWC